MAPPLQTIHLIAARLHERLAHAAGITLRAPQHQLRFASPVLNCRLVLTDSGGIQEETTYLGVPCLTLHPNTERPITVTAGTNRLCGLDNVRDELDKVLNQARSDATPPDLWDGRTAHRVTAAIHKALIPG